MKIEPRFSLHEIVFVGDGASMRKLRITRINMIVRQKATADVLEIGYDANFINQDGSVGDRVGYFAENKVMKQDEAIANFTNGIEEDFRKLFAPKPPRLAQMTQSDNDFEEEM